MPTRRYQSQLVTVVVKEQLARTSSGVEAEVVVIAGREEYPTGIIAPTMEEAAKLLAESLGMVAARLRAEG